MPCGVLWCCWIHTDFTRNSHGLFLFHDAQLCFRLLVVLADELAIGSVNHLHIVNAGSATEFLKIAAVGLFPQHRTVAQNLAGHLRQPGREVGFEMAVLLVNGCELARVRQRLARKAPEILVFAYFGVVHVALATCPLQQGFGLCWSG